MKFQSQFSKIFLWHPLLTTPLILDSVKNYLPETNILAHFVKVPKMKEKKSF